MLQEKNDQNKTVKYIPVIIVGIATVFGIVLVGFFYYFIFRTIGPARIIGIVILVLTAGLAATMMYVVYTRITEIKRGEEDDLGKY